MLSSQTTIKIVVSTIIWGASLTVTAQQQPQAPRKPIFVVTESGYSSSGLFNYQDGKMNYVVRQVVGVTGGCTLCMTNTAIYTLEDGTKIPAANIKDGYATSDLKKVMTTYYSSKNSHWRLFSILKTGSTHLFPDIHPQAENSLAVRLKKFRPLHSSNGS
jgi:hypothetical protein